MNITACIITDNNPKVLKAIESVYNFVNEIILVNTVKEFTLDISKLDKVKLFYFEWRDDFSKARNYSLSKATGDYIFIIDSDEILSSGDITKLTDEYDFYFVKIENDKNKFYDTIRFFKNIPSIKYVNRLHESVELACNNLNGAKTNIILKHSGYELTPDEMKAKAERNYRILLKDTKNIGRNIHFAKHFNSTGDYNKAIYYAKKSLKQSDINNDNKAILCIMIYECYCKMNMNVLGLEYLMKSISYLPMQIHARMLIVNYLVNLAEKEKTKQQILKQLITIGSLISYKNSELSNDVYCDINFINKKIKEIEKWQ